MSPLSRFMRVASAILDTQDEQRIVPEPHRPPIFVRTNWLFVEIDEAREKADRLVQQIRVARLNSDVATAGRLTNYLLVVMRQAALMASIANDQFQKDLL